MKRHSMKRPGFAITTFMVACILFSFGNLALPTRAMAAMEPFFSAKIYDLKDHSKHMFNYVSEVEYDGDRRSYVNTVTDLEGKVLVIEKTVATNGGRTVVSFEQDQKQLGTVGKLEVRDGKIHFTFTKDGKTKTDEEKVTDDFVVTSTLVANVRNDWAKIIKGESIKVRLGVLDRLETVGFQFKKESDTIPSGAAGHLVKMKPSSVIISALVNPLRFGFDAEGRYLLEIEGRTNVKVMVDGKWKDFDGFTVYSYPPPKSETPAATPTPEPAPAKKSKKKKTA